MSRPFSLAELPGWAAKEFAEEVRISGRDCPRGSCPDADEQLCVTEWCARCLAVALLKEDAAANLSALIARARAESAPPEEASS